MKFKILEQQEIQSDFFCFEKARLLVDQFSGNPQEMDWYKLKRRDGIGIILENTSTQNIILVEQFRYPVVTLKNQTGWIKEIIAGLIDDHEEIEACVHRETLEEAGYEIIKLIPIFSYMPSIAISDHQMTLFYGTTDNHHKVGKGGGIAEEKEDIRVLEVPLSELAKQIQQGNIIDSKTIIAVQWLLQYKQQN